MCVCVCVCVYILATGPRFCPGHPSKCWLWLRQLLILRAEYEFTYSSGAPAGIRIAYSAWVTLYMTCIRTYSRLMNSQNRPNRNRIRLFCSSLRIFPT